MEPKLYPTSTLRFVLREDKRILQQWWGPFFNGRDEEWGEWRDVTFVEQPDSADEG